MIKHLSFLVLAAHSLHSAPLDLKTPAEVSALFPKSAEELQNSYERTKNEALACLKAIESLPAEKRTFENTVREFDKAYAEVATFTDIVKTILKVYPDPVIRAAAQKIAIEGGPFLVDQFEANREVYRALCEYQANKEHLNPERSYHLADVMEAFRRQGFNLNPEDFRLMKDLKNRLNVLCLQFDTNISEDSSTLRVKKEQLLGLEEDVIHSLGNEGGYYLLRCDYPTRAQVMENCRIESTRRDYHRMFFNRAYPKNQQLLTEIISTRDTLASLLGFSSYAELDISSQMAKTPETVRHFLDSIAEKYTPKADAEWELLLADLPDSITLTPEGKIKPWDVAFLQNRYKKQHLHIDNEKIAEYFPMDAVVQGLLNVYGQFFGLKFKAVPAQGLWDAAVQLVAVSDPNAQPSLLGHLILDLFPRENKYSHACCESLRPPISSDGGKTYSPALAIVIANFSKPTESKPSLLQHDEVEVLFHEFGHAIHALLGRAEMPSKAAFNTKIDFVEAPSQLLEEWVWNNDVLILLSRHYLTKEPMPFMLADQITDTEDFDEGRVKTRQVGLAKTALNCFGPGKAKDLTQLEKTFCEGGLKHVAYDPQCHPLCSFGHLTGYGAKYYSYLWSKELAKQLFAYICSHGGPLDPIIGERYRSRVIGKGGSCDPEELVLDFVTD